MPSSDKNSHLNSDKRRNKQPWPDPHNQNLITTNLIGITNTYFQYKFIPSPNPGEQVTKFSTQKVLPIFKCQVGYLSKFVTHNSEPFLRWIKLQ